MAGLIAKLLGGKPQKGPGEPVPGIGGYTLGAGPANTNGYPGSTSQTRTTRGQGPRSVKLRVDTDSGANNAMGSAPESRQSSYRGDVPGAATRNPRATPGITSVKTEIREEMQGNPVEFFGGPQLRSGPGHETTGGRIGKRAADRMGMPGADARDTTTPWVKAQPVIGGDVPGAQNVRNQVAERYKNPPGQMHGYKSAARADQATPNMGGQATDGNVHHASETQDVTVPSRAVFDIISWAIEREMPYAGRGNGARGADLNGQRYYATGQVDQFWNSGRGQYGVARENGSGNKRPVSFTQPAPWTANFYDTTESVGTADYPNQNPAHQPSDIYTSPVGGRASNRTGRRG